MQFISLLAILALTFNCTLAVHSKLDVQWSLWKETYNKRYSDVEEHIRYEILSYNSKFNLLLKHEFFSHAIWEDNLKKIQEHNHQADLGVYTYWLGMNKYADMVNFDFIIS
jgi:hypothetical protein